MTLMINNLTAEKDGISKEMEIGFNLMAKESNKVMLENELKLAIQNQNTEKLNEIGKLFYNQNNYVEQNIELSVKAFQHSLKFGDKEISVCYLTDIYEIFSVDVDESTVLDTIKRAISVNYAEAMFFLGLKYSTGNMVQQNINEATYWFEKAHIYKSINLKNYVKKVLGLEYDEFSSEYEFEFNHDEIKVS